MTAPPRSRPRGRSSSGFSLIELLFAMAIVGLIGWVIASLVMSGIGVFRVGTLISDLETQANRNLQRITWELIDCGGDVVAPQPTAPLFTSSITYQRVIGVVDSEPAWGPPTRLEFQYDPQEMNDGFDNDGDSVVDEGRVVLIENFGLPEQRTIVLCEYVSEFLEGEIPNGVDDNGNGLIDEPGLSIDFDGSVMNVRLSLERRGATDQNIIRTAESRVRLRN